MVVLLCSHHVIPSRLIYHWRISRVEGLLALHTPFLHHSFPHHAPRGVVGEWQWHMSQICCLWTDGDFFPPGNIFKPRISMSTLLLRECVLLSLGLQLSEKKRRFIGRNMIVHMCTLSCKTGRQTWLHEELLHVVVGAWLHREFYLRWCIKILISSKKLPGWEIM